MRLWDSLLRSAFSFLLLLVIARWMVRRRLGKFGILELLAVNAMGDLTSHLAFESQHPILGGLASVLVWAGRERPTLGALGDTLASARGRWRHIRLRTGALATHSPPHGRAGDTLASARARWQKIG